MIADVVADIGSDLVDMDDVSGVEDVVAPDPMDGLPAPVAVDLVAWIQVYVDGLPGKGSEAYVPPSAEERVAFMQAVEQVVAGEYKAASEQAVLAGAELIHLNVEGVSFVALVENSLAASTGRGRYLVRLGVARDLLISAPHPRFDSYTGVRGVELFLDLQARAFAIAGTHRCANAAPSGCDGSTSVCGTAAPYRISDQAHTEGGFFQAFQESVGVSLGIQIHGFGSGADEPEFTLSDGTTANTEAPLHFGNRVTATLEKAVAAAGSSKPGNSCNRFGDINLLCGSTNTQGRWLNGVSSAEVCTVPADAATGAFLHMELSKELRVPGGLLEPNLVLEALLDELPAVSAP